jgi:hypothetical protein
MKVQTKLCALVGKKCIFRNEVDLLHSHVHSLINLQKKLFSHSKMLSALRDFESKRGINLLINSHESNKASEWDCLYCTGSRKINAIDKAWEQFARYLESATIYGLVHTLITVF